MSQERFFLIADIVLNVIRSVLKTTYLSVKVFVLCVTFLGLGIFFGVTIFSFFRAHLSPQWLAPLDWLVVLYDNPGASFWQLSALVLRAVFRLGYVNSSSIRCILTGENCSVRNFGGLRSRSRSYYWLWGSSWWTSRFLRLVGVSFGGELRHYILTGSGVAVNPSDSLRGLVTHLEHPIPRTR